MSRAAEIWHNTNQGDKALTTPLAIALGVLEVEGKTAVWVLDHSPLSKPGEMQCEASDVEIGRAHV